MPQLRRNPETGAIDGEHGLLVGQTRFGKTYLSKRIARFFRYVVVHDPKNKYVLDGNETRIRSIDEIYQLDEREPGVIVYAPLPDERDNLSASEEFCAYCYKRGNCLVVFDEVRRVGTINAFPRSMQLLYTCGAEEAICVLGLTQEAINLPSFVLTQSSHFYVFYHANKSHRDKMAGFLPIESDDVAELEKKEFYYWRNDMREPIGPIYL